MTLRNGQPADPASIAALSASLAATLTEARGWISDHPQPVTGRAPQLSGNGLLGAFRHLHALLKMSDGQVLDIAEDLAGNLPAELSTETHGKFLSALNDMRNFDLEGAAEKMEMLLPELEIELS
jgi:hypothetical protein